MDPEEFNIPRITISKEEIKEALVGWCDEAYDLLESEGFNIPATESMEQAYLAIRRMLGLYVENEQFEKCKLLKDILSSNFPDRDISPLLDYKDV